MIRVNAELFRQVARCCEVGGLRAMLSGVCIEPHPVAGVLLIATDGHRLICAHDPEGVTSRPSTILKLGKAGLKACKAKDDERRTILLTWPLSDTLPLNGTSCSVPVHVDVRPLSALGGPENLIDVTDAEHVVLAFPDWRRVCPAGPFSNEGQPSWQGRYLAEFADIAEELSVIEGKSSPEAPMVRTGGLSFEWSDPMAATLVHFVNRDAAFGILMPYMKLFPSNDGYPAFFKAKAPVRARNRKQSAIPGATTPDIPL